METKTKVSGSPNADEISINTSTRYPAQFLGTKFIQILETSTWLRGSIQNIDSKQL